MSLGEGERCVACTASTPPLSNDEVNALLAEIDPAWSVENAVLSRAWRLPDFAAAFGCAIRVAEIAESEDHHPDILVGWGRLRVSLTTHSIGGLSRNDFIVARLVDAALA